MSSLFDDIFGDDEPTLTVRKRGRRITPIGEVGGGSETRNSNRQLGRTAGGLESDPNSSNTESKSALDNPYSDYKDQQLKDLTTNLFSQLQQDPSNQKNVNALNNVRNEQASRIEKANIEERMDENPNFTGRMGADGLSMGRTRGRDITDKNVEYPATSPEDIENVSEATRHSGRVGGQESVDNTQSIQPGSDNISRGNAEDVPTYQGVSHITSVVMENIIDGVSDILTDYLLKTNNNRRKLQSLNFEIPSEKIPDITQIQEFVNVLGIAGSIAVDPYSAGIGLLTNIVKSKTDNYLNAQTDVKVANTEFEKQKKIKSIREYRIKNGLVDTHITKNNKSESLVDMAVGYIGYKAQPGSGTKYGGTNYRLTNTGKDKEYSFIRSSVIGPYLILALVFYKAIHESTLDLNQMHGIVIDVVFKTVIKQLLPILGLDQKTIDFGLKVLMKFPQELVKAFQRNIDEKSTVSLEEINKIEMFVEYIKIEYGKTFKGNYFDDVKKLQGKSMDLVGMMNRLHTPHVLHLFAIQIATADDIVWNAQNNQGLFLGLLELASIHHRGDQDEAGGSNYNRILEEETFIIGYVNYNFAIGNTNKKEIRFNKNLNFLNSLEYGIPNNNLISITNLKNKSALYKDGNNIVVALAGSKLKGRQEKNYINEDLEANLENIAGSPDFFLSEKYLESERAVKSALRMVQKTGGKVTVVGYSLGALTALQLASRYTTINVDAYEPVVGKNAQTDRMFKEIENRRGINIFRVNSSSISQNLTDAQKKHKINVKTIKQKRFSSHSLKNFN